MSEIASYAGNEAAGRLVQWAEAATAAQSLATQLCRTAFVPETFRLAAGESEEVQRDNAIRIGNATAALLLGAELGLDPIAALRALYVIRGQVAIYARMKLALLLSRGHRVWVEFESDERITVAGYRKDDAEHVQRVTWDLDRVKRAGFQRNDLYRTNPRAMLFARASSELAQRIAPDVLAGIPEESAEELGARVSAPESVPGGNVTVQRSQRVREAPTRVLTPVPDAGAALPEPLPVPPEPARQEPEPPASLTTAPEPAQETLPIPIPGEEEPEPTITSKQSAILHALFRSQGWQPEHYREYARKMLGKETLTTTKELTVTEASYMIDHMKELSGVDDAAPGHV